MPLASWQRADRIKTPANRLAGPVIESHRNIAHRGLPTPSVNRLRRFPWNHRQAGWPVSQCTTIVRHYGAPCKISVEPANRLAGPPAADGVRRKRNAPL